MRHSEQINDLATALATAQGAMDHAPKDHTNPAFKSRYADLASVVDACRPALSANGIAVLQPARLVTGCVEVDTLLVHKSGQWIAETLTASVPDTKAQTIGSAITYLRRYGLSSMVGVAPDDDDGQAATQPRARHEPPQAANQAPASAAKAAKPPAPAEDPKVRDDVDAALAKTLAAFPAAASDIHAAVERAATATDALVSLRALYTRLAAAKPRPPAQSPARTAALAKCRKALELLAKDAPSAVAQAEDLVSQYGGLDGVTDADLPALVSELDGLYSGAVAGAAA